MTYSAILRKFKAIRYDPRNNLAGLDAYFTGLENYQNQLASSAEDITKEGQKTHIFSTLMGHFYTRVCIIQRQRNLEPLAKEVLDSIRE
jgi:hypothetical protein